MEGSGNISDISHRDGKDVFRLSASERVSFPVLRVHPDGRSLTVKKGRANEKQIAFALKQVETSTRISEQPGWKGMAFAVNRSDACPR